MLWWTRFSTRMVQEAESLWEAVEQQEVARLKKEFTWLSQNGVADFQCPKIQSLRATLLYHPGGVVVRI